MPPRFGALVISKPTSLFVRQRFVDFILSIFTHLQKIDMPSAMNIFVFTGSPHTLEKTHDLP